ncbi:hypothetical protein TWF696_003607 [Orbilia brochopaga]|uniref:Uncharacterized protein n=1 Tax=Orbilia brochopaga TaxID=3140254 RepID=A0AAV9U0G8_9PEZI
MAIRQIYIQCNGESARSSWSKYIRQSSTTGEPVRWAQFAQGKPRGKGALLDTNVLTIVLESSKLDSWLRNAAGRSKIATCQLNVLEHISSSKVIKLKEHGDVVAELEAKGVDVIDGPCASSESTSLGCRALRKEFERREIAGAVVGWRGMLQKIRADLTFVCEGHSKGFAFITTDEKFQKDFAHSLRQEGMARSFTPPTVAAANADQQVEAYALRPTSGNPKYSTQKTQVIEKGQLRNPSHQATVDEVAL